MATENHINSIERSFKSSEAADFDTGGSPCQQAMSSDGHLALMRISVVTIVASWLPLANATFSIKRCCTLAVRGDFQKYYNESYPWQVCNFNEDINFSDNVTYPSIMRSMSWAREYCRGHQLSGLNQWLSPLCAYISPYIGLLLICPVGEVSKSKSGLPRWVNVLLDWIRNPLQEYMSILGDPASAAFGAFHEIWSDVQAIRKLSTDGDRTLSWFQRRALWIAVLMGDIKFTEKTTWTPRVLEAAHLLEYQTSDNKLDAKKPSLDIQPYEVGMETTPSATLISRPLDDAGDLDKAIGITLEARASFAGGVLIPVVLMLAVTAATFYDAYSALGDKDKALALAYCVWYSWILVVSVGGNCFATSINSGLARKAFGEVLDLNGEGSVALRDRYINSQSWEDWAEHADGTGFELKSRLMAMESNWRVWLWFGLGQFFGFCSVAFASACGTAIAWTTPTVGFGCRSFNFILYTGLAFLIAYLHVLRSWLWVSSQANWKAGQKPSVLLRIVNVVYWFLVFANSLVLVLGTLFHLVGVFRTCWCEKMTWSDSAMIELNSKTAEAIDNARKYWISTSYVAFGFEWLLCLVAIAGRRYIVLKMEQWPESREEVKKASRQVSRKPE
ncbi:hypothetical protein BJ875DRAFT_437469 [Amylocarpus encephaloides]|uniref:Uncharacterized protein n=1 Tax=Amylocarpus encephaloides TaxID=45428 RepID=A0A9P7YRK9_9HELO|nr:hypothetical protein BJ875DRAFT_437469 [Amylocarpus encephaloides]